MEGIRKQRIKENSFEAGCTSHLYELPTFHWSFYAFNGLREVLETNYGSNTVPHMLSDLDISRAFRGHFFVSGVLYATIISDLAMSIARSVQCRRERKRSI